MKKVEVTTEWPLEKILQYGPDIRGAIKKLVARFPEDVTFDSVAKKMFSGEAQLWILTDDERFCACALTEIKTNDATGHRFAVFSDMAGSFGPDDMQFFPAVQEWAAKEGIDEIRFVGRMGWKRMMKQIGYEPHLVYYRKEIAQ